MISTEIEVSADLSRYQDMRWCPNCGGEVLFVPCFEISVGRVGYCFGCDKVRLEAFTRSNSEG